MQIETALETNRHHRWRVSEDRPSDSVALSAPLHLITILYRSSKSFPGFLDGLLAQDRTDWRLHIVDNGDPESLAIAEARADSRFSFIRNPANFGFAKAANQGMRKALAEGARAMILMNNDTILPPDLLRRLGEAERQFPGAVLSPRVMEADRPDNPFYAGGGMTKSWVFQNVSYVYDPGITEPQRVEFAPGCCLVVPAAALSKIGFLDERFFVYWEDSDFCLRLSEVDIPIYYLPAISILHKGGESCGGLFGPTYTKLFYTSYSQFLKKHFGFAEATATLLRLARQDWELGRYSELASKTGGMLRGLMR